MKNFTKFFATKLDLSRLTVEETRLRFSQISSSLAVRRNRINYPAARRRNDPCRFRAVRPARTELQLAARKVPVITSARHGAGRSSLPHVAKAWRRCALVSSYSCTRRSPTLQRASGASNGVTAHQKRQRQAPLHHLKVYCRYTAGTEVCRSPGAV